MATSRFDNAQAKNEISAFDFNTGDALNDASARSLVRALVYPDHPLIDSSADAQVGVEV